MKMLKKVAMASLVGASLFSTMSFAAPEAMQKAADAEAIIIAKAVNNDAAISCRQAALRIGNKAKANAGKLKEAELHSAILDAISVAAKKAKIDVNCINPVVAANATSTITGLTNSGKTLGLAKAGSGTASGIAGLNNTALIGGGLLAATAIAIAVNNDDDESVSSNAQ